MKYLMRKLRRSVLGSAWLATMLFATASLAGEESEWQQPAPRQCPDLYCWADTCNVYVLKDGESAILIDLGDGTVLSRLGEIGVTKVDWVLLA